MAWEEIASTTLGSAAASVSFTTGLSGYAFYRLTIYIVNDANAKQVYLRLNNDSGVNYSYQNIRGTGSTIDGAQATGQTQLLLAPTNNLAASIHASYGVLISKPAAGVKAQVVSRAGNNAGVGANVILELVGGEWNNTADAISRIDVLASANNFEAGTSILLEGLAL